MNNTIVKGIIMTLATLLANTIVTTGWPTTTAGWANLGIVVLGTLAIYVAKNIIAPSTSNIGSLNIRDLISGAIIAGGNVFASLTADTVTGTPIDYGNLFKSAGTVALLYLLKNFATNNKPQ